jgi:hypothetical protein
LPQRRGFERNGDVATVGGVTHNSRVTGANPDPPPQTLSAAEETFRTFLASQNYPKAVCWVMPGDVVVDTNCHYWVRKREAEATRYAALRYSVGLERNLGVKLQAICATESETFASVFIPEDDLDAQYHLMGRGLKLSCPVEKYSTSAVRNLLRWRLLRWRNGQRGWELQV